MYVNNIKWQILHPQDSSNYYLFMHTFGLIYQWISSRVTLLFLWLWTNSLNTTTSWPSVIRILQPLSLKSSLTMSLSFMECRLRLCTVVMLSLQVHFRKNSLVFKVPPSIIVQYITIKLMAKQRWWIEPCKYTWGATYRRLASKDRTKWFSWAEYTYNTSWHSSTNCTPFKVVYDRPPPTLFNYILALLTFQMWMANYKKEWKKNTVKTTLASITRKNEENIR